MSKVILKKKTTEKRNVTTGMHLINVHINNFFKQCEIFLGRENGGCTFGEAWYRILSAISVSMFAFYFQEYRFS